MGVSGVRGAYPRFELSLTSNLENRSKAVSIACLLLPDYIPKLPVDYSRLLYSEQIDRNVWWWWLVVFGERDL